MEVDGVPVTTEAFPRTVRLVTTARLRAPVLLPLVDSEDELALLGEIVYDVPHAHFINASFAYARPQQPNRFNGANRGAWYAALALETCLAEVGFHLTNALADAGDFNAVVEYAEMFCSLAGDFLDLRQRPQHPSLGADIATAYPLGNALAARARAEGLNGIIYPSVRHPGGTCLVALRPAAVQSVRQGDVYRMIWRGQPEPIIEGPL